MLVRKLDLKTKQGDHLFAWFEFEGRIMTRTRRSEKRGDLPATHAIRQQLKLNEDELAAILACKIGRAGYIEILREKKIIEPPHDPRSHR